MQVSCVRIKGYNAGAFESWAPGPPGDYILYSDALMFVYPQCGTGFL